MSIATRGAAFVLDYHQKPLAAINMNKKLTVLDLIRKGEGANTPGGYKRKVSCYD